MDLRISNTEPKYDTDNKTMIGAAVSVSGYATDGTGDFVNARITLNSSDLESGQTFDDLTNKQELEAVKKKMAFK